MQGRIATPRVCALLVGADAQLRLRTALRQAGVNAPAGAGAAPTFVDTVGDLLAVLGTAHFAALVIEAHDRHGISTEEAIRSIRAGYPQLPILGIAPLGPTTSGAVLALARAGVHELVIRGVDDVGIALRSALQSAMRHAAASRVEEALRSQVPGAARPMLRLGLEHAAHALTVPELARSLGVHRRTLVNRLRAHRLPPPSEFLAWMRLLLAAALLEDHARPIERIALELQFPSANAFRNSMRRYTGLGPSEVRMNGGLACVVAAYTRSTMSQDAREASENIDGDAVDRGPRPSTSSEVGEHRNTVTRVAAG